MQLELIVTQGPYSSFFDDVARIPSVSGIRFNTIMPVKEEQMAEKLKELRERAGEKQLWLDLKSRQLRITEFAHTPYTAVTINHRISVNLPAKIYFDNGNLMAHLVDIDGYRLILEEYTGRILGPGEALNIPDDSLRLLDPSPLTERDERFLEASQSIGLRHFMLSYVEHPGDILAIKQVYPQAFIAAKIENKPGLKNLDAIQEVADEVIAARADLYTEIEAPQFIVPTLKKIYHLCGKKSIVASRMLSSLLHNPIPSCSDIMDIYYLKDMGYTRFMFGDDICFKKDILMQAVHIFNSVFNEKS
ncbi:MAG TPA: pyruvate kinase [Anaerolineaceae bacterium]|nr:pyruvate kinase [Anaerolineaceae bacterium]HPN50809.1 pyruvate kinase [Anaerolineaceae bacterium]